MKRMEHQHAMKARDVMTRVVEVRPTRTISDRKDPREPQKISAFAPVIDAAGPSPLAYGQRGRTSICRDETDREARLALVFPCEKGGEAINPMGLAQLISRPGTARSRCHDRPCGHGWRGSRNDAIARKLLTAIA